MYQAKGKGKDYEKLKNASPFLKEAAVMYPIIAKQDLRNLRWQTAIFPENLEMENFLWNCLICTNIYFETFTIYRKVKEQYYEPPHALHLTDQSLTFCYTCMFMFCPYTYTHLKN